MEVSTPQHPAALVGEWELGESVRQTAVTVDRPQDILDRMAPSEGSIAVTGDATSAFRWGQASSSGSSAFVELTTADPTRGIGPEGWFRLLGLDPSALTVYFSSGTPRSYREYRSAVSDVPLYTVDGRTVSMSDVRLTAPQGDTIYVAGVLTFPLRRLEAGVETVVQSHTQQPGSLAFPEVRVHLRANGSVTYVDGPPLSTPIRRDGSWEQLPDGPIRMVLTEAGSPADTLEFDVAPGSQTLVRSLEGDICAGAYAGCLDVQAPNVGVEVGTLTRIRGLGTDTLVRDVLGG
jgi:hypothetical protein